MKQFLLVFTLLILSSCGTLFSPSMDEINITSMPEGASVYRGSELIGTTPFKKSFTRDTFSNISLKVMKEGFESKEVRVQKTLNKVALFNLTSWPSWGTDALTGKMIKYSPNSYLVELTPLKSAIHKPSLLKTETVRFIAINRSILVRELSRGEGEVTRNLMRLYGLNGSDAIAAKEALKKRLPELLKNRGPVASADIVYETLKVFGTNSSFQEGELAHSN